MKKALQRILLGLSILISSITLGNNDGSIDKETQLNIYPNPVISGQMFTVEMEMEDEKVIHIYVYDFAGKQVMESTNLRIGFGNEIFQKEVTIDEKGLYLVKIVVEDQSTQFKQSKVRKLYVI